MSPRRKFITPPKPMQPIDYGKLAMLYNQIDEIDGYVELDQVYNITLFKQALERRGVVSGKDFIALNRKPYTYVIKKTLNSMQG